MSKLANLQQTFHDSLRDRNMQALEQFVNDTNDIVAKDRLAVYQANFYVLLNEVLTDTFSRLKELVGEECFNALAYRFISEHPPQSGCLFQYGGNLPDFIARQPQLADYPYLADVAQLDWLLNQAYYAKDAPEPSPTATEHLASTPISSLTATFPPATYFLESQFPLQHIWELALGERSDTVDLSGGSDQVLVIRPQFDTLTHWLEPPAFAFLSTLHAGNSLEKAHQAATEIEPSFELEAMLLTCLQNQYFIDLKPTHSSKKKE